MKRPRWLAPAELDAWLQLLALSEYLPAALDAQLKRDADIGRYEYSVLVQLADADGGPVPMSELSIGTFGSLSRLSHAVTRLETRGLVTRERHGATRYATITPDGSRLLARAARGHSQVVRESVFNHLSEEQAEELAAILRPVIDHLQTTASRT